jgi:hypothetical protein
MMVVHPVMIIGIDLLVDEIEIFAVIFDIIFLWMAFYSYMTLNKVICLIYCVLMPLASVIAITHIQRILMDASWL